MTKAVQPTAKGDVRDDPIPSIAFLLFFWAVFVLP
jgi:hypothetical protein